MNYKRLWLIGICSFVFFLLMNAPASLLAHFSKKYYALELTQVKGTIWKGSAQSAKYSKIYLGKVNWEVSPWSLLLLHINLNLQTKSSSSHTDVNLSLSMNTLKSDQIKAKIPASILSSFMSFPLNLDGELFLRIINLEVHNLHPESIQGSIAWQNAFIQTPFGGAAKLGNLQFTLSNQKKNVIVAIRDQGEPLNIKAKIIFSPEGTFVADGSVNSNLPENINNFFNVFAQPAKDGRRKFHYKGKLPG